MKKLIIVLLGLFLVGCSEIENKNQENGEANNTGVNVYFNTNSNCVGTKRIEKTYSNTDPKDMMNVADYVFIGSLDKFSSSEVYDDGKIKESMKVSVKKVLKGKLDENITVYRDGGSVSIKTYKEYPNAKVIDKTKLEEFPNELKNAFMEVVPSSYFLATQGKDYLFFIKNDGDTFMVHNDAYGMLEVLEDDKVKNVYTNDESSISELLEK